MSLTKSTAQNMEKKDRIPNLVFIKVLIFYINLNLHVAYHIFIDKKVREIEQTTNHGNQTFAILNQQSFLCTANIEKLQVIFLISSVLEISLNKSFRNHIF